MMPGARNADPSSISGRLVSRAGLAGGGAPNKDSCQRSFFMAVGMTSAVNAALRRLAEAPTDALTWLDVARAHDRAGRPDDAHAAFAEAHRLAPDDPAIAAYHVQADAERRLRHQLAHEPSHRAARLELAARLRRRHRRVAARAVLLGYAQETPDAEVLASLGLTELELGHQDEARRAAEDAVALEPGEASFHQLLCNVMAYQDGVSGADLTAALERCGALWPRPTRSLQRSLAGQPCGPSCRPDQRLRLGVLGAAFWRHPTTWLTLGAFEHLDPALFDIHCFAHAGTEDGFTARWRAVAAAWHDATGRDHAGIAAMIRDVGIDILIDLGGSLIQGQLPVLALRAAPVQLKWVGGQYHTTGLAEVDGFVTDRFETPPSLAHLYRERLLVMPDSYVCYDPPRDAPDIAEPPVSRNVAGAITFGSFNSLMKITPRVVDTWCAILRELPGSRLLLKTPQCEEDAVCDALLADFVARGVAVSRIDLEGESDHRGVLAAYGRVDIALQPFPYCGGVTLLEGLFMGVPSIAMTGESFAGRHGVSHLSNVGLADCVAADTADYVTRALGLARSTARLAALRRDLRERLAISPICDSAAFAGHFSGALRALHAACIGSP